MMTKMQPVSPQDRPKVIAVSISLTLALGYLAWNLSGTPTLARSGPAAPHPLLTEAAVPAVDAAFRMTCAAAGPVGAPETGPGRWGEAPLRDPFRPLERPASSRSAEVPARSPARPPAPASARLVQARPAPAAQPSPAPARSPSAVPDPSPAAARPTPAPAAGDVRVALTGTVGSGPTAVAAFHMGTETRFVRPREIVAGWRVVRIEVGQVYLTRRDIRRVVRVGNSLAAFGDS